MISELERHGLQVIGQWIKSNHASVAHMRKEFETGINFEVPNDWCQKRNIIYAFVINSEVQYIGETTAGIASRFISYRYGNPLERDTDNRVKRAITEALIAGKSVEIWASCPLTTFQHAEYDPIQVPASKPLEEYLIGKLNPSLNRMKLAGNPE